VGLNLQILFSVLGGVGDNWTYPNFYFFNNWVRVHVLFSEFRVYGVEGRFSLNALDAIEVGAIPFNLISLECFKSFILFWSVK
jgi:hypothetical protein